MSLRVAVQMDPIETVNIDGDSSFALMMSAQERGYEVFEYHVESLMLDAYDRLYAECHPVKLQRVKGDHVTKGAAQRLDLGKDIDVVLMRQDPPFHMGYITATHMLERVKDETLVVNDPVSVRNAPEKVMVLNYRRFMPPSLVTREYFFVPGARVVVVLLLVLAARHRRDDIAALCIRFILALCP